VKSKEHANDRKLLIEDYEEYKLKVWKDAERNIVKCRDNVTAKGGYFELNISDEDEV
jgi:hypothetical protein